jgi:ankyrin repeat protein
VIVSPKGSAIDVKAGGDPKLLKLWPRLQNEVQQWKFRPFEENGAAITAKIEEYIDLVPPERFPKIHKPAPAIRQDSKITIGLKRWGCYGSCPVYKVTITLDDVVFEGDAFVVAFGRHTGSLAAEQVQDLARRFVKADFYSMDSSYRASVTDCPTYVLSIEIDGKKMEVEDYEGQWEGMPAVIAELEDEVDTLAQTQKWIEGSDGLVQALRAEKFVFHSYEAQIMLKEAASRGKAATVREFLDAGVPLMPLPAPKSDEIGIRPAFEHVGWLNAADGDAETLNVLIEAGASKNDPSDKDLALVDAVLSGDVNAARSLIAYGANPNADLSKLIFTESHPPFTMQRPGAGNMLIFAAKSGNPEMIREILRYKPNLEARAHDGKTALFAAGDWSHKDKAGSRLECVRLLAKAGANVNARDDNGNTPLHETFLTDIEEELLKLGADVNAKNKDGETPIFTTVDDDAIPLFIEYGADLTIRNKKGETVVDAAKNEGPTRQEVLRKAIHKKKNLSSH